jgi:hypothetical protein
MVDLENGKWRTIAEKASTEMDGEKLTGLIEELNEQMDREEAANKPILN